MRNTKPDPEPNPTRVPLGFSDLTEDESLLITVYREWRSAGASRAEAEDKISTTLERDPLKDALAALFALFSDLNRERRTQPSTQDVLTDNEESFLDLLASSTADRRPSEALDNCRKALSSAGVSPRAVDTIDRSGQDNRLRCAQQSYRQLIHL